MLIPLSRLLVPLLLLILSSMANAGDVRGTSVVMMIGEDEYHTWETLPEFAKSELLPRGMKVTVVQQDAQDKNRFPGIIEALSKADLLVLSVRRRLPPPDELNAVRHYLDSGKPLVGIRTACHAFAPQGKRALPQGRASWIEFDPQVLGGHYDNHYPDGPKTAITVAPGAEASPILKDMDVEKLVGNGSLYRVSPIDPLCQALLIGTIPGKSPEPVAWTHLYGPRNARIFYTSLGHPDDFKERGFRKLLINGMLWALGQPSGVLVINQGGTYSGHFESNSPDTPVCLVKTSEPVVIENSTLRGPGTLIQAGVEHANITVRNTRGSGTNPNATGRSQGRFLHAESFDSVAIENNDLEGTAGIYLLTYAGNPSSTIAIRVTGNRAHNIDGRHSDGNGGYTTQTDAVQFLQLDQVRHVPNCEIAWNQVNNEPGVSGVEDVISVYLSSGLHGNPIRIHDNFIEGAYPADLSAADYSGGGIMLGDGQADQPDQLSCFVEAYDNQVLNTTNYGMAISAGHNCLMHNNRIVSTGLLPTGQAVASQNVGVYIWNITKSKSRIPTTFANNSGYSNRIGWMKGQERNDWWVPNASLWKGNLHWPGKITPQVLDGERALWEKKLEEHKLRIGAR